MKQLTLSLKNGKIEVIDIPIPNIDDNSVLIKNKYSLISSGTEGSLIEFGESNFIKKIINQKDKVQIVFDKLKRDGLISTLQTVNNKLNDNIPLGYCSIGEVIGSSSNNFEVGQKVVSNGPHAEYVTVPENLCHQVPDNISDLDAVFTVIASISLQGVRSLDPKIGDKIVVYGFGLIGQITLQILSACGCNVIGLDIDQKRIDLAKSLGISAFKNDDLNDTKKIIDNFSSNVGADGVIICAHSKEDSIINQSANYCRQEGKIILIGSTNLSINRDFFYKKQISFKVSSSYGPGRYDNNYEFGQDYPIGFVRWTANRNFGEILRLIQSKKLSFKSFISGTYKLNEFYNAYESLKKGELVSVFEYNYHNENNTPKIFNINNKKKNFQSNNDIIMNTCFIGSGNFSSRFLIPHFKKEGFNLHTVISNKGISAHKVAKKFNFEYISSNIDDVLKDENINNVVISTPHHLHSDQLLKAIKFKKKNIYIDKPLAINLEQINEIKKCINSIDYKPNIIIGYNRKFSPLILFLRERLNQISSPKFINININAGFILKEHWINDKNIGGGRLVGEGCHFIDLSLDLINSKLIKSNSIKVKTSKTINEESFLINLYFEDSSVVNINYMANGSKSYIKEKIEVFCNRSNYIIEDFKNLKVYGDSKLKNKNLFFQDKGLKNLINEFKNSIVNNKPFDLIKQIEVSELVLSLSKNISSDE